MTGFDSKRKAALDEDGMYLMHQTAQPAQELVKYKCTVIDDQHPQGIPLEQWGNTGKAQPAQEPVVWMGYDRGLKMFTAQQGIADAYPEIYTVPLYPSPPQRPWVDLTDGDISEVLGSDIHSEHSGELRFIRAVLAKSKEKNNG
jgi:hypothetical protein